MYIMEIYQEIYYSFYLAMHSLVLGEGALFLRMLHHLLVHEETLATSHTVHVELGAIGRVCFLAKVH